MHSDLILTIAHWVSIAVVALVLFLMTYILFLRALLLMKERRYRDFSMLWSPILLNGKGNKQDRPPRINYADRFSFLILWNTLREGKDGDVKIRDWMNSVAIETGIDRVAIRLLKKRSIRKKLLAVVTLGQLRDKSQWEILYQMALSDHALLSLAAAQALARIDREAAVPIIVPLIVRRMDWPAAKVASILGGIGPDLVAKPLADAIMEAPAEEMQRLIPYLETCHDAIALPVVHRILNDPPHDKVIGPCLYVIGKFRDKNDLKLVRQYLTHPRWHVRAHAAACLGRIGTKEDEAKLAALLADPEWWVRYRAAQAIVDLSFSSLERIRQLKEYRHDRYARDILEQVIVEKRLIRQ
jgi:hypothetical protein